MSNTKDQEGVYDYEGAYDYVRSSWADIANLFQQEIPPCPTCGSTDPDCEEDCAVRIEQRRQDTGE